MQRPTILTGLLTGALIASLSWNVRHVLAKEAQAPPPQPASASLECCPEMAQEIEATQGLTQAQLDRITQQCGDSCQRSIALDQAATTKLAGVWNAVADSAVSGEAVHQLVEETLALRAESLRMSVQTALEVREDLPADLVQSLFQQCNECCTGP